MINHNDMLLELINDKCLTEAFSVTSISKTLDLIGKYLTKYFVSQAKWMKGAEENIILINGIKYFTVPYFFANGAEFRIGFKSISGGSVSISRIDYWKPGFNTKVIKTGAINVADFSVSFDVDLSVMQIFPKVLPAIKTILTTKNGTKDYEILINGPKPESLTEAVAKKYTGSKTQIVRDMLTDGKTKAEIYAVIGEDASAKSFISKIGKELGVVVTAHIKVSGNKTEKQSVGSASAIKKGYKLIPKYADINTVYDDLNLLLDAVILKKKFNALIISGSTGTGKTQNLLNFLKDNGLKSSDTATGTGEADYMIIKGGNVSAFAMFQNMFEMRETGKIIILDDADAAFDDSMKNNLLKSALDSYDERFISWETKNPNIFKVNGRTPMQDGDENWVMNVEEGKYPNRFAYKGQIIIVSNKHISDFDAAVRGRCITVDITIKSEDMLSRIETLIDSGKTFGNASKASMQKTLKFMKTLPGNNKKPGEFWPGTTYEKEDYILIKDEDMDVNFRTYLTVLKFVDLGFPDAIWQRLAMKYAGIPEKLLAGSITPDKE
jgi:hypothetical protein